MVEFFSLLKKLNGLHGVQIISINLYFDIKFQCLCKLSTKSAPQSPSDRQVSVLFIRKETQRGKASGLFKDVRSPCRD